MPTGHAIPLHPAAERCDAGLMRRTAVLVAQLLFAAVVLVGGTAAATALLTLVFVSAPFAAVIVVLWRSRSRRARAGRR